MSLIGTSNVNDLPNITGSSDGNFDNLTATNISVSNKISFEEADATDEGNMTTYIYQDPATNDIVVNNNNPLGSFRLQYGNTPDTNVLSFEIDSFNQKLNFPVGVNPEYNISFEELYALKGVNINQSIQQQINSINQISQGTGYWGTFFSSIDQYSASANTPTVATLNGYDTNNNGIILFNLVSGNYQSIKVLNGAVYNIQICFQTSSTSSSTGLFRAWFKINGVDIPNSSAGSSHHTNNGYFITTFNLILPLLPNDVLTLYWASSTGGTHLEALPAQTSPFACPTSPSVYVSFQQITYYQRAELQNIYGILQSNTTMTDASPNYVGVKWQSGFTAITLPSAATTPLGKEYTFFMINPMTTNEIAINTVSGQYAYYFGFSDITSIILTRQTQSFVFTCISNSASPQWSINQVEYDPSLFFNLSGSNIVPYATTFTQQGTTTPAIKLNAGTCLSLLGNLLVNGATISPTELSYLDGTTGSIQGQLNTLQQKTTAMTYNSTGQMTTIAHNLTVGSLYSENYIFVQGTNINDLYIPAGLCYSKSESDAKYATQAELGTVSAATGLNTAAIALYITGVAPPNIVPVFFGPAVGLNNAFPAFVLAYTATATTVGTQGTAITTLQTKTQFQTTDPVFAETTFSGKLTTTFSGKSISIDPTNDKIYSATTLTLGSGNATRVSGNDVDLNATSGTINLAAPNGINVDNVLKVDTINPRTASTISLNSGTTGGTVNIGNTLDLVYINGLPFSLWFFAQW